MSLAPAVIRSTRDGVDGWLDLNTRRWLPRMAGADDDPPADPKPGDPPADPKPADPPPDPKPADPADPPLGEGGQAALKAERDARKAADKRAADAEKKLQAIEDAKLSDADKAKKAADDATAKATKAVEKLREANLLIALGEHNLIGAKAKAAAKLLEDVEYDDDDEPTNLEARIEAATATYGEDIFKGATPKPKPPNLNGGEGNEDREGPKLTAEELAMAKSFGMTAEEYAEHKSLQPSAPATT